MLGNIFAQIMSARQNNKVDDILSGRMNDLQAQFDKSYNTQFLDTEQGKSAIKLLSNNLDRQNKKIDNASVVGGATAEATNAAREKSQGMFDQALTRLAGYGTQYKDMKEREYN
ncbi:MAG: hypothetical protein ACWGQW_24410, partial [bacterium]